MDKITKLVDKDPDARRWTATDALHDAIKDSCDGERLENHKKVLILHLDDSDDDYKMSYTRAGLTHSESIALMEYTKQWMCEEMRG
jgi:hypothetical protein